MLQHVSRRHETFYILLHVAGVCVFHTLNLGVLGASAGLQSLVALIVGMLGLCVAFDSVPHVPLFIKTRVFLFFPISAMGVLFLLNLWQNVFRSSANAYVPAVFARFGQSCVATLLLFFGKFVFRIVYDRCKQRQDGNQRSILISIGARYKLVTTAARMEQSVSNLAASSDDQPPQIEVEPVLEDAMDIDTARIALQWMKRKNLVRTRGSEMLSHDQHAVALDVKGRGSFASNPSARKDKRLGGDRPQDSAAAASQLWAVTSRQSEVDAKSSEAAELLSACQQLSTSFAVCLPFRPVNSLVLAKRISVQRWYFVLAIVSGVVCIAVAAGIFENIEVSIISSCMIFFVMIVEASRLDRSLVWHLLCSFEVLVFMFSTYSFSLWNILDGYYFRQFSVIRSICNNINFNTLYTFALLTDGAPMFPLWLKRVFISLAVLNMIVQLAFRLMIKNALHGDLCVNASLCVSPAEVAFYRCVWS